jgi:hypothetical protein
MDMNRHSALLVHTLLSGMSPVFRVGVGVGCVQIWFARVTVFVRAFGREGGLSALQRFWSVRVVPGGFCTDVSGVRPSPMCVHVQLQPGRLLCAQWEGRWLAP